MKVIITTDSGNTWHCKMDSCRFWEAYQEDPEVEDTGAPVYREASFDSICNLVEAYEQGVKDGSQ
jgi:hypothetical protein